MLPVFSGKVSLRVAPWISWKEWDCVRLWLLEGDSLQQKAAMDRVAAWQSRGRVPLAVEITAELAGIRLRDPASTAVDSGCLSEELLRLGYAMAIMRLVSGVVDQSQKSRFAQSIADLAVLAGLPRLFVDIRHEAAHNQLPSINLLRLASKQAVVWLQNHYWEAQRLAVAQGEMTLQQSLDTLLLIHIEKAKGVVTGTTSSGKAEERGRGRESLERATHNVSNGEGENQSDGLVGEEREGVENGKATATEEEMEEEAIKLKKEKRKLKAQRNASKKNEAVALNDLFSLLANSPLQASNVLLDIESGIRKSEFSNQNKNDIFKDGEVSRSSGEAQFSNQEPRWDLRQHGNSVNNSSGFNKSRWNEDSGLRNEGELSSQEFDNELEAGKKALLKAICRNVPHLPTLLLTGIIQRLTSYEGRNGEGKEEGKRREGMGHEQELELNSDRERGERQGIYVGRRALGGQSIYEMEQIESRTNSRLANWACWLLEEEGRRQVARKKRQKKMKGKKREGKGSGKEEIMFSDGDEEEESLFSDEILREFLVSSMKAVPRGGPLVRVTNNLVQVVRCKSLRFMALRLLKTLKGVDGIEEVEKDEIQMDLEGDVSMGGEGEDGEREAEKGGGEGETDEDLRAEQEEGEETEEEEGRLKPEEEGEGGLLVSISKESALESSEIGDLGKSEEVEGKGETRESLLMEKCPEEEEEEEVEETSKKGSMWRMRRWKGIGGQDSIGVGVEIDLFGVEKETVSRMVSLERGLLKARQDWDSLLKVVAVRDSKGENLSQGTSNIFLDKFRETDKARECGFSFGTGNAFALRSTVGERERIGGRERTGERERTREEGTVSSKWKIAENWHPCPVGMVPCPLSPVGRLPSLDFPSPEPFSFQNQYSNVIGTQRGERGERGEWEGERREEVRNLWTTPGTGEDERLKECRNMEEYEEREERDPIDDNISEGSLKVWERGDTGNSQIFETGSVKRPYIEVEREEGDDSVRGRGKHFRGTDGREAGGTESGEREGVVREGVEREGGKKERREERSEVPFKGCLRQGYTLIPVSKEDIKRLQSQIHLL